ncbi:squalene/phytoene synthase family protein [Luteolibacter pohnpeiensis]|uniref:Squalene/phytoene synthase family protein n=1 Tax=Luteolibacter pohnpeiensis TaxID=454153 RepID=A0A934VWX3_9BACT|nr:phytoene/squalene synthase family protein [Luteolibacter pohnpeiensis]MBK1883253.1 squalene/phytoene synthase family protein [Luteolibacter pohnpeiensis]
MESNLGKSVLKEVSRSFYLSLRLLPREMRTGTSIGYLLARTSDTIADTAGLPVDLRLQWLERFSAAVVSDEGLKWSPNLMKQLSPSERALFQRSDEILKWYWSIVSDERELIEEVVSTIIAGQRFDLERFANASASEPVALTDEAELENYTWHVAGCVGAFWTKLGHLTLGDRFSGSPISGLLEKGIRYGKGLQLVNILRDLPEDLAAGRCYLPVENPQDIPQLMAMHARWLERASQWIGDGEEYGRELKSRRLRMASVLPARIAAETLSRMKGASWSELQNRIKVPRRQVYGLLLQSLFR